MLSAILAFAISVVSLRLRLLTVGGAVCVFIMGWIIFGLGKWSFSIPILAFFATSNLLSRMRDSDATTSAVMAKTDERDLLQVLANGLLPTILVIIWYFSQDFNITLLYLAAVASATADTWATEVGIRSGKQPRSILTCKHMKPGTSGGITLPGSVAAVAGALFITVLGMLFFPAGNLPILTIALIIVVAATMSQFIDSLLGASLQAAYTCRTCGAVTERSSHCTGNATISSGLRWVTNDTVNFLSVACGVVACWLSLAYI